MVADKYHLYSLKRNQWFPEHLYHTCIYMYVFSVIITKHQQLCNTLKNGMYYSINHCALHSVRCINLYLSQVKMICCYLAVPDSSYLPVLQQSNTLPLCKLIICIKAFQWQLTAVLQHSQFFSSKQGRNIYELIKKQQFSMNIKMRTALKLL